MDTKNAHRSFCFGRSAGTGMMALIFLYSTYLWAGPIATHNKEYKELAGKILAYEKRVQELVEQKANAKDGVDLENVLTEISDLQKELVGVKKKRRDLRDHVKSVHPQNEILEDLSILKDAESHKKADSKNPDIEKKLDQLLLNLRAQYSRSAQGKDEDYSEEQQAVEQALNKKKKHVEKAVKDEYIRENIKTKLEAK